MAYVKTAKDKAWDQERMRLKSEIAKWITVCGEKQAMISEKNEEIAVLAQRVADLEAVIAELTKGEMTADEGIKHLRRQSELAGMLGALTKGVPGW